MAGSETFGVESGFEERVLEWMNSDAKKRKLKFEARSYGYSITTKNFVQNISELKKSHFVSSKSELSS